MICSSISVAAAASSYDGGADGIPHGDADRRPDGIADRTANTGAVGHADRGAHGESVVGAVSRAHTAPDASIAGADAGGLVLASPRVLGGALLRRQPAVPQLRLLHPGDEQHGALPRQVQRRPVGGADRAPHRVADGASNGASDQGPNLTELCWRAPTRGGTLGGGMASRPRALPQWSTRPHH